MCNSFASRYRDPSAVFLGLLIMSATIIPLARRTIEYVVEHRAVAEIEAQGGIADVEIWWFSTYTYPEVPPFIETLAKCSNALLPGDYSIDPSTWDFFQPIIDVTLHDFDEPVDAASFPMFGGLNYLRRANLGETTNADSLTEHLDDLVDIRQLSFFGSDLTDEGLGKIATINSLQELDLGFTKVTDTGISGLSDHPSLRVLVLADTSITEKSLAVLCTIPNLTELHLQNTNITREELDFWLPKFPNTTILCSKSR